jgi:hypothetical protein
MAPAKKLSTSKAPKKAATKSATTHPQLDRYDQGAYISMVYSVSTLLVTGAFSFLTELCVVVFSIVFLKRGRLDFRSLPYGVLSRQCVAPTRCIRAARVYSRVFISFCL